MPRCYRPDAICDMSDLCLEIEMSAVVVSDSMRWLASDSGIGIGVTSSLSSVEWLGICGSGADSLFVVAVAVCGNVVCSGTVVEPVALDRPLGAGGWPDSTALNFFHTVVYETVVSLFEACDRELCVVSIDGGDGSVVHCVTVVGVLVYSVLGGRSVAETGFM